MKNKMLTDHISIILNGLLLQGLKNAVIAPGSRSTPLALGLAQLADEQKINLFVDVDERSAAFFALGIAKKTNIPVLLVCTSGTAAANFYPAICEAKISHIPLIVLTTDRPPELTNIAAPQAIDQNRFFGNQVKDFIELPLPETNQDSKDYTNYIIQQSFQAAMTNPVGPIHLNQPFRKPLMPDLPLVFDLNQRKYNFLPFISSFNDKLSEKLHNSFENKRGIILAGPQQTPLGNLKMLEWAKKSGWPILADPLSELRGMNSTNLITCYDSLLKIGLKNLDILKPDIVIRTGQTFVAASLVNFLKNSHAQIYFLDENNNHSDYTKTSDFSLNLSSEDFFEKLRPVATSNTWLKKWIDVERIFTSINKNSSVNLLNELDVVRAIAQTCNSNSNLFVSNSMPIRDVDSVLQPTSPLNIFCNRGANGIDGIISTALGISINSTNTLLLTGDLAFFHDMNGLMMAKKYHLKIKIIVINNNGGGIFSFLPQAGSDNFETVFGTPLDIDIAQIATLYNAKYSLATTDKKLKSLLKSPTLGLEIIEVPTNRNENVALRQSLIENFKQQITKEL